MSAVALLRSSHVRNMAAVALLLALGPIGAQSQPAPAPPAGPAGPMRVTSDTPEYCDQLSERVTHAEHTRLPTAGAGHKAEVEELAAEGHQMCSTGLIRPGLARLRRAWMLLRSDN
jgi:hypothetical protein